MNRQMFEQMMQRLGSSSMLPPPSADYAPGGSMFPGPTIPGNPSPGQVSGTQQAESMIAKLGKAMGGNSQSQMAGKGGGG